MRRNSRRCHCALAEAGTALGNKDQAIAAYRQALTSTDLEPERRFLTARLAELG